MMMGKKRKTSSCTKSTLNIRKGLSHGYKGNSGGGH